MQIESLEDTARRQLFPVASSDRYLRSSSRRTVRRIGRVRVPLAGPYRPWATLFRLPDGRLIWCLRCWDVDRVLVRCVSSDVLRTFAKLNRLPALSEEIDRLVDCALGFDVVSPTSD